MHCTSACCRDIGWLTVSRDLCMAEVLDLGIMASACITSIDDPKEQVP